MAGPYTFSGQGGGGGGTPGAPGEDGREVELSIQSDSNSGAGYMAWRYVGDPTWTFLIDMEDLRGPPGADGGGGSAEYSEVMKRVSLGF